ncbi:FRG domain-containing protein [Clostridiaceae bacterium]|nr:FRG domain-containing protein [Clostridiaceae bacterium]RKI11196.1 FRG domain-containing protein [bacterium 1XD21-70]
MAAVRSNILPKEKNIRDEWVRDVSQFIKRVNEYIQVKSSADSTVVYRGEPEVYPSPCRPNIFRKGVMDGNRFFEKSLFDTMRQNKLTGESRYLDNAIDAQHGEFPSRLLDVSYNCLTALYFAVTPYYHNREDALDGKDGMVFLFFVDEIFSPSAQNTNDNYDAIIKRDCGWYQDKQLFEKNHKFIDHTKLNNRIIAQQGAFILFPGDEPENLPECMGYGIRIPGEAKPLIRRELKQLFGIHTGSIYPEIINLVGELSSKSKKLNTEEFNCKNELLYAWRQMEKELDYYLDYAIGLGKNGRKHGEAVPVQVLMHMEHVIDSYRKGFLEFARDWQDGKEPGQEGQKGDLRMEDLKMVIEKYNQSVEEFSRNLQQYGIGEISEKMLLIRLD